MLSFIHDGQSVVMHPGDLWTAAAREHSYRDIASEALWSIVSEVQRGTPWRKVVDERYAATQPWLHQIVTSPARALFFQQHPPPPGARILDIGAGWGQIALPLARLGNTLVTALEPTAERLAFIQAAAAQEHLTNRMHFVQADFLDLQFQPVFDLACCIGVLEWIPKFRPGDPRTLQTDFLRNVRGLLCPGGQLVIGIENRLGLKYVMGAPDDHIGFPDIAVYDAKLATQKWLAHSGHALRSFTYTQVELAEILRSAGFQNLVFFAALPDYKLPQHIVPLDQAGALDTFFAQGNFVPEHSGRDGSVLPNQAELQSHYRSLAQLGISRAFAPSFFVIAS